MRHARVQDVASLHEKAVQAVSVEALDLPRTPRRKPVRRASHVEVMRVRRDVWAEVKRVIRPGQYIVIVSAHEVWLLNDCD